MQVEWYRSFTEAVKWKSLSKAAEKLSLTQPAISKHIRNLETAFGVELFRRGTAGVELTEAGKLFLERITPVVEAIDAIEEEMRQLTERPRYALGSLPSVAAHVLPARLRDYHAAGYPLAVSVRGSSEELTAALREGSLDAVLIDAEFAGGGLWSRDLFIEHYVAVLPQRHALQDCEELSVDRLRQEPFVFLDKCDSLYRFERVAERYGFRPNVRLKVDSTDYLLGVVAVGTGITVLPSLFRSQAERLGLHAVPIREPELRRTIALAARTAATGGRLYRLLELGRLRKTEAAASPT